MLVSATNLALILDEVVRLSPQPMALKTESVFDRVTFADLDDSARCALAKFFISRNCPSIGAYCGNFDAPHFIANVAADVVTWPMGRGHNDRRLDIIAYALDIASQMSFVTPPGALASVYLLHQLEFFFRVLSGVLHPNGTFIDPSRRAAVIAALPGEQIGGRINGIALTYKIMQLNLGGVHAVDVYRDLDNSIPPVAMPDGTMQNTVGDRVTYFRHTVSHGEFGDPSSEGLYYALLTAIAIYGSTIFERR
jgi:hypothetical protein